MPGTQGPSSPLCSRAGSQRSSLLACTVTLACTPTCAALVNLAAALHRAPARAEVQERHCGSQRRSDWKEGWDCGSLCSAGRSHRRLASPQVSMGLRTEWSSRVTVYPRVGLPPEGGLVCPSHSLAPHAARAHTESRLGVSDPEVHVFALHLLLPEDVAAMPASGRRPAAALVRTDLAVYPLSQRTRVLACFYPQAPGPVAPAGSEPRASRARPPHRPPAGGPPGRPQAGPSPALRGGRRTLASSFPRRQPGSPEDDCLL